ncbi:hypothetical protein [Janthinobacterium violaceinigrum]|uniref:DUF600 family protein n=1 Tax=Janthinobacterium violaceinigrum TaxID=2654252 RepID=A0A6I1HXX8_9BURK|nr:hypothetical protein [Janthinobacterium violaceinigrum]KAB8061116.1 hypothetical protein GCN75_24270 [Janthinobacterium violaceinigrum]
MDSKDVEISKEIGQCLYDIAPEDAKTILMIAALSPEGDVSQFEFYSNNGINESEFSINDSDTMKLHYLAGAHQKFMVANKQPAWTRCEFTVNVDANKFSMELGYEEDAFRDGFLR